MHPGDLAGGFSDIEMTWPLYCAGAATENGLNTVCMQLYKTQPRLYEEANSRLICSMWVLLGVLKLG